MKEDLEFTLPGKSSELYLLLEADYTVKVLDRPQGSPTGEVGSWTVVYDQSIVVELPKRLPERKMAKFMANMRYSLKDEIRTSQYDGLKCGSYEAFNSRCDETMVGVKFNHDRMVQCWVGYQTEALTDAKPKENELAASLILAQTDAVAQSTSDAKDVMDLAQNSAHSRLGRYSTLTDE